MKKFLNQSRFLVFLYRWYLKRIDPSLCEQVKPSRLSHSESIAEVRDQRYSIIRKGILLRY